MKVKPKTQSGTIAGEVVIKFDDPPTIIFEYCSESAQEFVLPEGGTHIWTLAKTYPVESNNSVVVFCNNMLITELVFAESTNDDCVFYWSRAAGKIVFDGRDTASRFYRARPPVPENGGGISSVFYRF